MLNNTKKCINQRLCCWP